MTPKISVPRGATFSAKGISLKLIFHPSFQQKWQGRFDAAQKWLDGEVIANTDPYVPFRTGVLAGSAVTGSAPGSGQVVYSTPYARQQYYSPRKPGTTSPNEPLRGPRWFDRSKATNKKHWVDGVRQIVGRGGVVPSARRIPKKK